MALGASTLAAATSEMEGVGVDRKAGAGLDPGDQIVRQDNIEILNLAGIQAGEVAVGITAVAIETTTGPIQALDHTGALQRLKVLINGRMADVPTQGIELLEDVAGAEMILLAPEQIQHQTTLLAESHAEVTAALVSGIDAGRLRSTLGAAGQGSDRG